jgi:hypothetical protein
MRYLGSSVLYLLCTTAALAADSEGRFAVKGAGISDCSRYVEAWEKKSDKFYAYGGWIEGYLSATNQYRQETYDIAPWETTTLLAALLAEHCRAGPDKPFIRAVRAMVAAIEDDRLTDSSVLVTAKAGDRGVRVYREILRRAQRVLSETGLYAGEIDGLYSDATRAAISQFQDEQGLAKTGLPDQLTLNTLLRRTEDVD